MPRLADWNTCDRSIVNPPLTMPKTLIHTVIGTPAQVSAAWSQLANQDAKPS